MSWQPLNETETRRLVAALVDKHLSIPHDDMTHTALDQFIYNIVATTVMDTILVIEGTVPLERYEQPHATTEKMVKDLLDACREDLRPRRRRRRWWWGSFAERWKETR